MVCRRKRHDQPQLSPLSSTTARGFALFCFQHKGKEVTLDASGLLHLLQIYTGGYKTCSLKQTDASPTRWAQEGVWWYSNRHVKHKDMVYYNYIGLLCLSKDFFRNFSYSHWSEIFKTSMKILNKAVIQLIHTLNWPESDYIQPEEIRLWPTSI